MSRKQNLLLPELEARDKQLVMQRKHIPQERKKKTSSGKAQKKSRLLRKIIVNDRLFYWWFFDCEDGSYYIRIISEDKELEVGYPLRNPYRRSRGPCVYESSRFS